MASAGVVLSCALITETTAILITKRSILLLLGQMSPTMVSVAESLVCLKVAVISAFTDDMLQ